MSGDGNLHVLRMFRQTDREAKRACAHCAHLQVHCSRSTIRARGSSSIGPFRHRWLQLAPGLEGRQ